MTEERYKEAILRTTFFYEDNCVESELEISLDGDEENKAPVTIEARVKWLDTDEKLRAQFGLSRQQATELRDTIEYILKMTDY